MTHNSQHIPAPSQRLHLAVDLTGAGAKKLSWHTSRQPEQTANVKPFDVKLLLEQVQLAQNATFDFLVLGDSFTLAPGGSVPTRGQVDAALIAARIAPVLDGIGLIPAINTTHTEPFHVSKLVATLDHVSHGRGGWEPTVSTTEQEAKLFGRKAAQNPSSAWAEAEEVISVSAKLWDSWQDDAEIRDVASGRFIDRDRLHYVDHEGVHFSVKGPSITPRPPQGHPVTVISIPAATHAKPELIDQIVAIAAEQADVVRLNAATVGEAAALRTAIKQQACALGRTDEVLVYVNIVAVVAQDTLNAQLRQEFLETEQEEPSQSLVFAGTPVELAQLGQEWLVAGAADGLVLKPGSLTLDLRAITTQTVPLWAAQNLIATSYEGKTLRDHLGLSKPANRYAPSAATTGAATNSAATVPAVSTNA